MSLFRRSTSQVTEVRNVTVIELSDESRQALISLDNDIQTLCGFMEDVSAKASKIMASLHGEIVAQIPDSVASETEIGVESFADRAEATNYVELPGYMHYNEPENSIPDNQRIRSTPFTRSPRHVQVDWLSKVMADGGWYPAITIARQYATDERHFRYMKSALTTRMREMHEEGLCERRDSKTKGCMFEYRLVRTPDANA